MWACANRAVSAHRSSTATIVAIVVLAALPTASLSRHRNRRASMKLEDYIARRIHPGGSPLRMAVNFLSATFSITALGRP